LLDHRWSSAEDSLRGRRLSLRQAADDQPGLEAGDWADAVANKVNGLNIEPSLRVEDAHGRRYDRMAEEIEGHPTR
jgi:hypothetical protein